ncbi:MAG: hypothetical protein QG575_484, partial [Euryarchaeota archaeon]|nr:hypothetical protein [Euryarchaeota archaeon]
NIAHHYSYRLLGQGLMGLLKKLIYIETYNIL